MSNWLQADSEERVQIADHMKGYDRLQDASVDKYRSFVLEPAFVAGIIDNRGLIYPHIDKGHVSVGVLIGSKNRPLLEALQEKFAGRIEMTLMPGSPVRVDPNYPGVVRTPSYAWAATANQARQLIHFVQNHLKIPPYAGWDQLAITQIREEKIDIMDRVHEFVIHELIEFYSGNVSRISTAAQVAERFGLSKRTAMRRLELLPDNLRKERESLLRGINKRQLTKAEARNLMGSIIQEIEAYQQGNVSRLTSNEEWITHFSVGRGAFNRLIERLPKEVKQLRAKLIPAQITRELNKRKERESN